MSNKETEQHSPEQEQAWFQEMEKLFRQAYHMGKIFCEVYQGEADRYDHETHRVLCDKHRNPEGMPAVLTHLMDAKRGEAEREAWENRTTEIVNTTETWLHILEDGALEIQYVNTRYDQGYLTPTVELNDVPKVLSKMASKMKEEKQKSKEDPIGAYADKVSHSPGTVLGRSQETFILRQSGTGGGTVEKSGWTQEYDYDGKMTRDEISHLSTFPVGSNEINHDIMTMRFNMFSKLNHILNNAVSGINIDYNKTLLTPDVRQNILKMVLDEIRIAAEIGKFENKEEVSVQGHFARNEDLRWPTVKFSRHGTTINEDGTITKESTRLEQPLMDAYMVTEIEVPPPTSTSVDITTQMDSLDKYIKVVTDWTSAHIKTVGEDKYTSEVNREIEKLMLALENKKDAVYGQIRFLNIDPTSGTYAFHFVQRISKNDLGNDTGEDVHIAYLENRENPSPAELASLLGLAI